MNTLQTLQSNTTASCSLEDKKQNILSAHKKTLMKLPVFQAKGFEHNDQKNFHGGLLTAQALQTYFSDSEIHQLYEQLQRYEAVKFLAGTASFQNIFFTNQFVLPTKELQNLLNHIHTPEECVQYLIGLKQDLFAIINHKLQQYKSNKTPNEIQTALQHTPVPAPQHYHELETVHKTLGLDFIGKLRNQSFVHGLPENTSLTRNRFSMNPEYNKGNIDMVDKQVPAIKQALQLLIAYINSKVHDPKTQQRILEENNLTGLGLSKSALQEYFKPIQPGESFRIDAGSSDHDHPIIFEIDDFPRGNIHYIIHDLANKKRSPFLEYVRATTQGKKVLIIMRDGISPTNQYDHEQLTRILNMYNIAADCIFEKDIPSLQLQPGNIRHANKSVGLIIQAGDLTPTYFEHMARIKATGVPMTPTYSSLRSKSRYGIMADEYRQGTLPKQFLPLIESGVFANTITLSPQGPYKDFVGRNFGTVQDLLIQNKNDIIVKYIGGENGEGVVILNALSGGQLQQAVQKIANDIALGKKGICIQTLQKHSSFSDIVYHSKTQQVQPFKGKILTRLYMVYEGKTIRIVGGEHMLTTGSKGHGMVDMAIYPLSDRII